MQVVALELADLPGAVSEHPRHPQDLALADPRAEQHRDRTDQLVVLFPDQLVGRGPGQPERHEDPLQRGEGDVDLFAQSRERLVRTWRSSAPDLDVAEREVTGCERLGDRLGIDPHRIEIEDDTSSQDRPTWVYAVVGLQDAERREPPDVLERRAHPLSDLFLGEAIVTHQRPEAVTRP